ncbi:MAG: radical SAM protein [Actinomycetota bacterium]
MKIDLKNPAHIKLLLLSKGVNFKDSDLLGVGSKYSENRYYYNISNEVSQFKNQLPSEILLPKHIESSMYFNPDSELRLKTNGNKIGLFRKNDFLCRIYFNPRPNFFDKKINNDLVCKQVVSMYGRHILALFSNAYCFYFMDGNQCKFCSLQPSRQSIGKQNINLITPEIAKKAVKIALKNDGKRIKYIMYTCGTNRNEEKSYMEQSQIIKAVRAIYNTKGAHHLTIMPTVNDKLLVNIKKAGLDSIAFDIEVFDESLFQQYCPGKQKYFGRDNFLLSFKIARSIFGHNNVKAGFVGGLEPLDSMKEGMEFFGSQGVSIAVNVFHPDVNTEFSNKPRPEVEYLLKMAKMQSEIYIKYKLKSVFPVGGRRSSLDTEIYRNFF